MLDQARIDRIESLGDNCELGMVMRKLGYESGSFFRWTLCPSSSVIKLIDNKFDAFYRFDDLTPHTPGMVMDQRTGIAFHSDIRSKKNGDVLDFISSEEERRVHHKQEEEKARYLRDKFFTRVQEKGRIYVIKRNHTGLKEHEVRNMHKTLSRSAGFSVNLLWVSVDPEKVAQIDDLGDGVLRSYISRLALYRDTADNEHDDWVRILSAALDHVDDR